MAGKVYLLIHTFGAFTLHVSFLPLGEGQLHPELGTSKILFRTRIRSRIWLILGQQDRIRIQDHYTYNDAEKDSTIDVMRFDEERKEWEVIHSCQLGNSGAITFKCQLGAIKRKLSDSYMMVPRVYMSNHNFAVAKGKPVLKLIRPNFGSDVREFGISAFTCKEKDTVESQLLRTDLPEGFTFSRVDPFKHGVKDIAKTTNHL